MGALGAVLLAEHNPGSVRGLVLIAPWVGEDDLVGPVARAGGLRAWRAPPIDRRRRDLRQANYIALSWLRAHPERASGPEIYLGVGEQDRRRATTELIAEVIEPERVRRVPGGHDWRTWRAVWQSILRNPPWDPGSGAGR
ncbi:MAG: lysophospholipase, partial [Sandaracinaceae bacterium]|nr:lysophospholipase [Sandaracinaceae bacterium]